MHVHEHLDHIVQQSQKNNIRIIRCRTVVPYLNLEELVVSVHHCHKHYAMASFVVEEERAFGHLIVMYLPYNALRAW